MRTSRRRASPSRRRWRLRRSRRPFDEARRARGPRLCGDGGTLLGDSVALSGNGLTLAVSAPNESSGAKGVNGDQNDTSVYSAGAVYVYTRPNRGGAWTQQAYVKASNPQTAAEFGHVVNLSADGNTMAVSAYFEASATKGINGNQND